ncbi:flagellin [Mobiluncus mulieris]|uniref:flagellin N-terminal helical domain-containing protein n=1 Tax=Mobiluncus mulieris TaxID=2052 RepID=UPI003211BDE9
MSILGMLRPLIHPTGMCKMPGQGVLGGLAKSLEKLSSGFRINRAADDAAGLAISEGLRTQVRGNKQAVRNAQDGISVIQTAEGALNEVHSILQRMRELAVQGANDSNDLKSRGNIKAELVQLRDELNRIGSVTNFNGTKLLNGDASGNNAMKFQVGANGTENDRIVVDFKDADVTAISQFMTKNGQVSNVQEATSDAIGEGSYTLNMEGKLIHFTMGAADKLSEKFEAALKASGVDGVVAGAKDEIKTAVAFKADTELAEKTFTLTIGADEFKYKVTAADVAKANGASSHAVMDGLMQEIKRQGKEQQFQLTEEGGNVTLKDLRGKGAPIVNVKLSADADNAVNGKKANENLLDGERLGTTPTRGFVFNVDDAGKTIKLSRADGKAIDIDMSHSLTKLGDTPGKGDKNVAWTVNKKIDPNVTGNYLTQDIDTLSVKDHESAQLLINTLDDKINSVSTARANLGAIQNRFEHTIANLNVAVENLAASESRIRDTDMAQEMMQFTRNQILSQAGTSMLAQANQVPQGVLSLLR